MATLECDVPVPTAAPDADHRRLVVVGCTTATGSQAVGACSVIRPAHGAGVVLIRGVSPTKGNSGRI